MRAGNREGSPGAPGLWGLRKFSRVSHHPLYLPMHAGDRGGAQDLPGLLGLCRFLSFFREPGPRGPLSSNCGRERAPPGGHHGYCGPLVLLELSTLQLFPTFNTPSLQGPTPACSARDRAPPGGHHGYCGPLAALEPSTLQLTPFWRSQLARRATLGPGQRTGASASPARFQGALHRPGGTFLAPARALVLA